MVTLQSVLCTVALLNTVEYICGRRVKLEEQLEDAMPTTMLHFRKETTNLNDFPAKEMPLDVLCNDSHHFQSWHQ